LLLMTLWLPLLNYSRSYGPMVDQVTALMTTKPACVNYSGLNRSQIAAFQFHGKLSLKSIGTENSCEWLIADVRTVRNQPDTVDKTRWQLILVTGHPAEREDSIQLFKRQF